MAVNTVFWTEFVQSGITWRLEIFRASPSVPFDDPACIKEMISASAIVTKDSDLNNAINKHLLGLRLASQIKIKIDISLIPEELRGYITNPNGDFGFLVFNPSTTWILRRKIPQFDEWNIEIVGTQSAGLLDEYKIDDNIVEFEITDIRKEILDSITFDDLNNALTNQYSTNENVATTANRRAVSMSDAQAVKLVLDYYVASSPVYYKQYSIPQSQIDTGVNYMQFYRLSYVLNTINQIANSILAIVYSMNNYLPRSFGISNPAVYSSFYKQNYNTNAGIGSSVGSDDLWIFAYITRGSSRNDLSQIADGFLQGKSSIAEKYKGRGITEFLSSVYRSFLVKENRHDWQSITPAPIWSGYQYLCNQTDDNNTAISPAQSVFLHCMSERVLRKPESFVNEFTITVSLTNDESYNESYTVSNVGNKTAQTKEFEIALHNMPSMKRGSSTFGNTAMLLEQLPLGVLFYYEPTLPNSNGADAFVRVHSYAFFYLDEAGTLAQDSTGKTSALHQNTAYPFGYATLMQTGSWDVIAAWEQGYMCTPIHIAKTMLRVFGDSKLLEIEYEYSISIADTSGQSNTLNKITIGRLLTADATTFKRLSGVYPNWSDGKHLVIETSLDIHTSTLSVKCISQTYNGE